MPTVHRKTPKGVAEIETRAHRLPPRLRSALILVDGRRSDAELAQLIAQDPEGTLRALAEQGFIEAQAGAAPAPRPASAAPAPAPAPASPAPPAKPTPAFEQTRRDAVRTLTDLIGPVGEALAMRMERARSAEELKPLLALAQESIANTRGRQAAADYGSRFGAALG